MMAQKRIESRREYIKYNLPKGARITAAMNAIVPCCSCGKEEKFGMMFTSQTIHNDIGLGYPVCVDCYKMETENRKQANRF